MSDSKRAKRRAMRSKVRRKAFEIKRNIVNDNTPEKYRAQARELLGIKHE